MQKLSAAPGWPQSLYDSPEWKNLRLATRRRDHFRCVVCGRDVRGPGQARSDHIKSVRTHPELALKPSNIRTLCVPCDNQRRERQGRRNERAITIGCDRDGWPLKISTTGIPPRKFPR